MTGDDIMPRLDELLARGIELRNMDTEEPLSTVRDRIQSANVYLGAAPLVEALQQGAQIVITGRATDTGLTLAPLIHEFGWAANDWNRLAAGTIAGHIIECGAQCSGGNCQYEWRSIPDLAEVGFPIVEAAPDGTFVITKHEGTGGRINIPSVKEQLVYEMGDPHEYITPDCVADFTTIRLQDDGRDRVRVHGIEGRPATEFLKVSSQLFRRVQGGRNACLCLAGCVRESRSCRKDSARATGSAGIEIRTSADGVCRSKCDAWTTRRRSACGFARGSIACRSARPGSQRNRAVYQGDCSVDSHWSAGCYRFCRWPSEGRGDCCLLACAHSEE